MDKNSKMKKLRRLGLLFLINAVILLPLVYGFEFFFRWKDPHKNLPINGWVNGEYFTWGHKVTTNRFGLRERDFQVPKPRGAFRIIVLGDSLTWGVGLATNERYSELLEQELRRSYPAKNFEVLNFGISGLPTTTERDLLEGFKDIVQPDLIIIGFCVNDPQPKSEDYSIEREEFERAHSRGFASLKYRLGSVGLRMTAQLIRDAVFGLAEKTGTIPTWHEGLGRTYVRSSPEWQEFVEALQEIKVMSDQMKLPTPIFATLNSSGSIGSDYAHPSPDLQRIIDWCRQGEQAAGSLGFETLDYEKEIPIKLANDSLPVNVVDGHPSARLNQLYAEKLFRAVVADLHLK